MPDFAVLWSDILEFLADVRDYLRAADGYGAFFGFVGLLVQLFLRAEWPTGRLNVGAPGVMDQKRFIGAVAVAVVAGLIAVHYFPVRVTSCHDCRAPWLGNAIAIIAFGYVAADLVPSGFEKLGSLLADLLRLFKILPKKTGGA